MIINIYSKKIIKIVIVTLALFTAFLFYQIFSNNNEANCNCFGNQIIFSTKEAIFKNIILIIVSLFLLFYNNFFSISYQKIILFVIIIGGLALPIILSPPDFFYNIPYDLEKAETGKKIDLSFIESAEGNGNNFQINNKKTIVCFFSTACKFCNYLLKKYQL